MPSLSSSLWWFCGLPVDPIGIAWIDCECADRESFRGGCWVGHRHPGVTGICHDRPVHMNFTSVCGRSREQVRDRQPPCRVARAPRPQTDPSDRRFARYFTAMLRGLEVSGLQRAGIGRGNGEPRTVRVCLKTSPKRRQKLTSCGRLGMSGMRRLKTKSLHLLIEL